MMDRYGRTVTVTQEEGEDVYTVDDGLALRFPAGWPEYRAMDTINAHAPEGWVPPNPNQDEVIAQIQALMEQLNK